jgi:hypothetical protein
LVQVCPELQAKPQVPQLFVLLVRLVSQPLEVGPVQWPKPVLHALITHAADEQALEALASAGQGWPHPPQLEKSSFVSTHDMPQADVLVPQASVCGDSV